MEYNLKKYLQNIKSYGEQNGLFLFDVRTVVTTYFAIIKLNYSNDINSRFVKL